MKAKGDLTLITNQWKEQKSTKEKLEEDIKQQNEKLKKQRHDILTLDNNIQMQRNELRERETTIKDKDIKIYELKKRT